MAERRAHGTRIAICALALALGAIGCGLLAEPASAETGIDSWSVEVSTTQAGGHPDVGLHTTFKNSINSPAAPCLCDDARIIRTHFPTGFIGNPHAIPKCTLAEFAGAVCPPESQVGIASFLFGVQVAVYNMETHPDEAGLVGFKLPLVSGSGFIELSSRTDGDYGLSAESSPIFHLIPIEYLDMWLWGVPAAAEHDKNRWGLPNPEMCFAPYPESCFPPLESNIPAVPYLQNPTNCGDPLSFGLDIEYYNGDAHHADTPWPSTTGCEQLSFDPSLSALPTTRQADTASGLDVSLIVPQTLSPTTPTSSQIRSVSITLPEGFSINPNAADGKTSCTDAEAAFGTREGARCPETAKVGTVRIDSSALPGPIYGAVYLGRPLPGDRYRLFLTADGFATHVKLAGTAQLDPVTGQIVTSFGEHGTPDLPQSPLSRFDLHFFGSERGLLATPEQCGTYPIETEFVPWNSALPNQHSTSFFTIDSGPAGKPCPPAVRPFDPAMRAGTADNTAGQHSSFGLELTRPDGDQVLTGLEVRTPRGFAASLRGIPYCPEPALATLASRAHPGLLEQATPACPATSQIGSAVTAAGAGTHPLHTPGKVYLAGPYKGAPLSLVVVVPAVSGPYDLGNVAVRAAIEVDPSTAEIQTVSDPIPTILEGIPLRLRSIRVDLDRRSFVLNPTNCDRFGIGTTISGDEGAVARPESRFQASNCADLGFSPKLKLRLTGSTKRRGHPELRATLKANPGEANISRVAVTLPGNLILDQSRINGPCTRVQFAADACPATSILGRARATTPILDGPLSGPVYMVSSGEILPDLVASLGGQVDIDLRGSIDAVDDKLRTTFETVPDVPVSEFSLTLEGGKSGLVSNRLDLCKFPGRAVIQMRGQNNRRANSRPRPGSPCARGERKRRAQREGRG